MEKFVGMYREFGFAGAPEMKDSFEATAYPGQREIAAYLRNGDCVVACPKIEIDVFTGAHIRDEAAVLSDGEFKWPQCLAYYVETYNLRLPPEFETHILKSSK